MRTLVGAIVRKPWIPAAAGLALMLAALAWRSLQSAAPFEDLVIAEASQPAFALLYVADAKGYFRDERVNVRFRSFTLGRDALDSAIAGQADVATVYRTPTLIRLYEGRPLAIVTTLHTSSRSHVIVARKDRGIATAADLRGRRIGMSLGTSTEFFLHTFLAAEGIAAADVRLEAVEPAGYQHALTEGGVDALAVFNPHPYTLERNLGKDRLRVFESDVHVETSLLVGMRGRLDAKREAVRRVLRALGRAQEFLATHPEESILIVAERLMTTHPEFAIRKGWGSLRFGIGLDNVLVRMLAMEADWLEATRGLSGKRPDLEGAIAAYHLASVDPESVTLLPRPRPATP